MTLRLAELLRWTSLLTLLRNKMAQFWSLQDNQRQMKMTITSRLSLLKKAKIPLYMPLQKVDSLARRPSSLWNQHCKTGSSSERISFSWMTMWTFPTWVMKVHHCLQCCLTSQLRLTSVRHTPLRPTTGHSSVKVWKDRTKGLALTSLQCRLKWAVKPIKVVYQRSIDKTWTTMTKSLTVSLRSSREISMLQAR